MYLGKIMEMTSSDELYSHPLHPYTQALISAAPIPDPVVDRARERILLEGEIPSPINPPKGCNFCTRCKYADERCRTEEPQMVDVGNNHKVACHRVDRGLRGENIMGKYFVKRVLLLIPTILLVCIIVFALMRMIPMDAVATLQQKLVPTETMWTKRRQELAGTGQAPGSSSSSGSEMCSG